MAVYQVSTAVFEGPLDLLLQLVTRHQLDVTQVSLLDVVSEYMSILEEMQNLDLDVASEFLLIASTLLQLKATRLLPDPADVELDEELALREERDLLIFRLLACVTFKDVAAVLALRLKEHGRFVSRTLGITDELRSGPVEVRMDMSPESFVRLAQRTFERANRTPDLDHLDLELPSVEDAIADLRRRLELEAATTFEHLVAHLDRRVDVVAYFLALLELGRWGLVRLSQPDPHERIHVSHVPSGQVGVSEWT